jgi:hypothetical protein
MSRTDIPSPAHWSKDFVEHLRTVHFTLIGVATALILIVLSAKPYNPTVALRELHQIINLKGRWSPRWITELAGIRKSNRDDDDQDSPKTTTSGDEFGLDILKHVGDSDDLGSIGKPDEWKRDPILGPSPGTPPDLDSMGNYPIPLKGFYGRAAQGQLVQFSIDEPWVHQRTAPDWAPDTFPSTLFEFQQWWNTLGLQKGYKAIFPRTLQESGAHVLGGQRQSITFIENPERNLASAPDKVPLVITTTKGRSWLDYKGDGALGFYLLPVRRFVYVEITQQVLSSHFNWHPGSFNTSFPDLALATHDLETLELEGIEKIIAGEAAKGSEVFEAFGMKFPAGQVTLWGIVVLLAVQLYFFVYLKQLSGKLEKSDGGWDVPWIGMDVSMLARIMLFLSTVVLPLAAMTLLAGHALSQGGEPLTRTLDILRSISLYTAVAAAGILGILSWTYRPVIRDAGKPPEAPTETGQV